MRPLINITLSICLLFAACNGSVQNGKKPDTVIPAKTHTSATFKQKPVKSPRLPLEINTLLSHKRTAFRCDSAIIVNYKGLVNGHTYFPVNEEGRWLNTITKRKKLNVLQLKTLNTIIGRPGSFRKPVPGACYEPGIGVVYFKDGKVIGQSAISLNCALIKSTAQLGNSDHHASFNKKALRRLERFYNGLKW